MYVTRPLSQLLKSLESLASPPEGPNSGYLVIQDDECVVNYSCFGLCKNPSLKELPFPQDKELKVWHIDSAGNVCETPVFLIPVLNQPLSSNRYYAISGHGEFKGEAFACSWEEDKGTCCFRRYIKDVKLRPLDPHNTYQQFEISPYRTKGSYFATCVAPDGFPPSFIRRKCWSVMTKTPGHFKLYSVQGLDSQLRAHLPNSDFSLSQASSEPVVVGKWYSPFIFVNEGKMKLRDQMTRSMYYEVTLEQRWEQIFKTINENGREFAEIDTSLEKEEVFIGGMKAMWDEKNVSDDGVVWFTSSRGYAGYQTSVGLRWEIVERMKWEQERGGWVGGEESKVKIDREEKSKNGKGWTEFGCYVLVERFNLKRMDGSLVMCYDFKHFHLMKTKWE